jgi:hypothetical protein
MKRRRPIMVLDQLEDAAHSSRKCPSDDRMTEGKKTMPTSNRDRSPGTSQEEAYRRKVERLPRQVRARIRAMLQEALRQNLDLNELTGGLARENELFDAKSAAVHEAGHAVAALAVGFRVSHLEVNGDGALGTRPQAPHDGCQGSSRRRTWRAGSQKAKSWLVSRAAKRSECSGSTRSSCRCPRPRTLPTSSAWSATTGTGATSMRTVCEAAVARGPEPSSSANAQPSSASQTRCSPSRRLAVPGA